MKKELFFSRLIAVTAVLLFVVIVLGGATRVMEAGLSCPDWPLCYGKAWPFPVSFEETGYTNLQVFLEWVHRLCASIAGGLVLLCAVFSFRFKERPAVPVLGVLSIVLLSTQVFLGKFTVDMQNENWTVALHLGNAALLFAFVVLMRKAASVPLNPEKMALSGFQKIVLWLLVLSVFATLLLGAMVSKTYAGGVCGGLLSCHGSWLPSEDMAQLLHMKHRFMALTVLVLSIVLFVSAKRGACLHFKKTARGLKIIVGIQVLLGILTLYSFSSYASFYEVLSVVHLAWGVMLFMACVGALGKLYFGVGGGFHDKG